MKLIIQIPCLNEAATLPTTLADLPRSVPGFDTVEWLVIDDGSTDGTARVARGAGVDHILRFNANKGLAVAFQAGMDACLKLGADVIVNTDADNQYCGEDVLRLVEPILARRADMVIGDRQVQSHPEFSRTKKTLQRLGSWVVRRASGTEVPDATSGFRAYTRDAALRLNVVSSFSYTLETLIQAGKSDIAVVSVPVRTNPKTRESRLFKSTFEYVKRSVGTILRIWTMYGPLPAFLLPALIFGVVGAGLVGRFLWHYFFTPGPTGHVQSVVLGAALLIVGFMLVMLGIISDMLRANRVLTERTLHRVRHIELALGVPPDVSLEDVAAEEHLAEERRGARSVPAGHSSTG
ncbi:MAG TPA: glycosyltransferase family 2 protein [Gaiellaceae bacterium]|nr:glycosyltransferase family 2 protein [Gaiellaceae bacterium]